MPIGCLSIETLGCLREQRDPGLVIDRVRRRDVGEQPTAGALQMLRRLLWFHARDDRLSSGTPATRLDRAIVLGEHVPQLPHQCSVVAEVQTRGPEPPEFGVCLGEVPVTFANCQVSVYCCHRITLPSSKSQI